MKNIAIGSACLGNKLVTEANQASTSIVTLGHSDWESPFGIQKSGNEMSVDFGQNADDILGTNPSRAIGIPRPQVTSTRLKNCNISDLVRRILPWHGTMKSESENLVENLRDNKIYKNSERANNF